MGRHEREMRDWNLVWSWGMRALERFQKRKESGHLVGFLCAKLDVGGVHVAVTYSTHFH